MPNKRNYKGSLRLDWINKDHSLYYEIDEKEGKGVRPVWVQKNDIRVAEPRILRFAKDFGDKTSDNMLIKGDNLLVLRSLVEMFRACLKSPNPSLREAILGKNALKTDDFAPQMTKQ